MNTETRLVLIGAFEELLESCADTIGTKEGINLLFSDLDHFRELDENPTVNYNIGLIRGACLALGIATAEATRIWYDERAVASSKPRTGPFWIDDIVRTTANNPYVKGQGYVTGVGWIGDEPAIRVEEYPRLIHAKYFKLIQRRQEG